jgi:hypothetical protein
MIEPVSDGILRAEFTSAADELAPFPQISKWENFAFLMKHWYWLSTYN